jgi:ATP-dependent Clp protease ATP-binding subunit ClpC
MGRRENTVTATHSYPAIAPTLLERIDRVPLDASCEIEATQSLDQDLRRRIVGQDESIDTLVCSYAKLLSGLRDRSRPLSTALLLGPTGVGKTETAKALAQTLFGSERALTRINCEEYAHGHEISKLLGAPPGYVGQHLEPLLSQNRIDAAHHAIREPALDSTEYTDALVDKIFTADDTPYQSLILFDEIEKAHPVLWNALLGILEDGMLTLGDNTTTDFTNSIILMTSNVGSAAMTEILSSRPVGFHDQTGEMPVEVTSVRDAALGAAMELFPIEFLNRFDEILVYSELERPHLEEIFEKFLTDIHTRAMTEAGIPLLIKVTPEAKSLIIDRGFDPRFGARPLRRSVERALVDPLSRFIAGKKLAAGDVIEVEREDDRLMFFRGPRGGRLVA